MADRYNVTTPRKGSNGQTYFKSIGTAFPARSGDGFNIFLDALPLPDPDGKVVLVVRPAQERGGGGGRGGGYQDRGYQDRDDGRSVGSNQRQQRPQQEPIPGFDNDDGEVPF